MGSVLRAASACVTYRKMFLKVNLFPEQEQFSCVCMLACIYHLCLVKQSQQDFRVPAGQVKLVHSAVKTSSRIALAAVVPGQ